MGFGNHQFCRIYIRFWVAVNVVTSSWPKKTTNKTSKHPRRASASENHWKSWAKGAVEVSGGKDPSSHQWMEVEEIPSLKLTFLAHESISIFLGKYHQNGGFSMAMLVSGRVAHLERSHTSCFRTPFSTEP